MRFVCSVGIEEVKTGAPDVLVLPERTTRQEIGDAMARWPKAIIVGATEEGRHVRGHLFKDGIDRIDYLKFSYDGVSRGTNSVPASLTFEDSAIAIGVLICRDFQQAELRDAVMNQLALAKAPLRLVCIPADMGSEWFPGGSVNLFTGAYLAVSNNRRTPNQTRRRSFIASQDGVCLAQQYDLEALALYVAPPSHNR